MPLLKRLHRNYVIGSLGLLLAAACGDSSNNTDGGKTDGGKIVTVRHVDCAGGYHADCNGNDCQCVENKGVENEDGGRSGVQDGGNDVQQAVALGQPTIAFGAEIPRHQPEEGESSDYAGDGGSPRMLEEILIFNAGDITNLTNHPYYDGRPSWRPNVSELAFETDWEGDGNIDIFAKSLDGRKQINLTDHQGYDGMPAWSPDGTKIAFVSERGGNKELYTMNANGRDQIKIVNTGPFVIVEDSCPTWSPDGKYIAFTSFRMRRSVSSENGEYEGPDIYKVKVDTGETSRLTSLNDAEDPHWSPNGDLIAYSSNGSIFTMRPESGSDVNMVTEGSPNLDRNPVWNGDGTKLLIIRSQISLEGSTDLYIINADGIGNGFNLTNTLDLREYSADWKH